MPNVIMHGIKYSYDFKSPSDPKQAIILVHGAGGNKKHMSKQLSWLGRSFLTMAVDLPGHGESEGQAATSIEAYSNFIADFADHVLGSRFFLAGHSMGSAIALDFALRYTDQIRGLIIMGGGAKLKVAPKLLDTFGAGQRFASLIDLAYGPQTDPAIINQARQEMENANPNLYYQDFLACDGFDVTDQIQHLHLPTLILGARQDQLTPMALSYNLAQNIKQSVLKTIDDAGHMMMVEKPDQVNRLISDFIISHKSF